MALQNYTPRSCLRASVSMRQAAGDRAGDAVRISMPNPGRSRRPSVKVGITEAAYGGDAKHLVFLAGNRLAVVGHDSWCYLD